MQSFSKISKSLIMNRLILIILAFIITVLIFLLLFSSCTNSNRLPEESNYFQGFSASEMDSGTSSFNITQPDESSSLSVTSDISSSSSEPIQEPNAYTKMLSGDIYIDKNNSKTEDQTLRPFFDFWAEYFSEAQTEPQNIKLLGSIKYNEYNSYTLYYACYSCIVNSQENHVALVYACLRSDPNRYILVDARIIDSKVYSMYFEEINKLIFNHNTLKIYSDEDPIVPLQDGLEKIDLQNIIGEDKLIYSIVPIKDDIIAIFSSSADINDYIIRIDLFNITEKKLTGKSHILTQLKNKDIQKNSFNYYKQSDSVLYMFVEIFEKENEVAAYKIVFGDNGIINDTVNILNSDTRYDYYDKISRLRSESGRYEAYYKDSNLYILDTVTKSSSLIYKNNNAYGVFNFFDGDVVYYSTYKDEGTAGLGRYNVITKENVFIEDVNYSLLFAKDEYIYACDDVYTQNTLLRFKKDSFKADTPLKLEMKVISTSSNFSYFNYTKNRDCIAQIISQVVYSSIFLSSDKFEVILYDTDTFTQLKKFDLHYSLDYSWSTEFTDNYGIIYDIESALFYVYPLK